MIINRIIQRTKDNPKKLFLIDGFGAILSTLLLGIVLVELENIFGIPKSTLYFLALLPSLFASYDFYCYYKIHKYLAIYLKGIAITNLIYCCLSLGLAIYHREEIKSLGWIYISIEILITSSLAVVEMRVAMFQIKLTK